MTWIIAITWTVSLILTGKIAKGIGWNEGYDARKLVELLIRKEGE